MFTFLKLAHGFELVTPDPFCSREPTAWVWFGHETTNHSGMGEVKVAVIVGC